MAHIHEQLTVRTKQCLRAEGDIQSTKVVSVQKWGSLQAGAPTFGGHCDALQVCMFRTTHLSSGDSLRQRRLPCGLEQPT